MFTRVEFNVITILKHHFILEIVLCTFCISSVAKAEIITFGSYENQFNMEFVEIGYPGNIPDSTSVPIPASAGAVSYTYQMGKFEVSRDMISKANMEGGLGITLHAMEFVTGGLRADMPATGVSWNEAARFVNWLNTSEGFQAAYKFTTAGPNDNIALWDAGDIGFNEANPFRNSKARYVLPTIDEWHKAAYFDSNTHTYFDFPNGSDTASLAVASGTTAGTAVYDQPYEKGPADITQAGGLSPFGIMGLGGNVFEWEETTLDPTDGSVSSQRALRGSAWAFDSFYHSFHSASYFRNNANPGDEGEFIGFRVASLSSAPSSVPEPSSYLLMLTGMAGYGVCRWRLRKSCS